MKYRKLWIAVMFTAVSLIVASSSFAAEKLAFKKNINRTLDAQDCVFQACGNVSIFAPQNGYVIVTATGTGAFVFTGSFLDLTLSTTRSERGPWLYRVTPGPEFYQSYSVQYVFFVKGGKEHQFYLNGRACKGQQNGDTVTVQTGSLTAEFYQADDVDPQTASGEEQSGDSANADEHIINIP